MIRAVICDDEAAAQKIIGYLIEAEGLPIEIVGVASTGDSALALIEREKPDIAFLDIQMPTLDGFEVMERLKDTQIKIIMVTVFDTFAYAQKALRLGACDIIAKPIDLAQLRQAIARAIGWNFTANDTLNRAMTYIHQHYQERIKLESLAREACCTPSHVAHLFKQHLNLSMLSYVHKIRITKAKQLLQEGTSIQEAAYAVGYESLNNFYKYFKQYVGSTPAAYCAKEGTSE